MTLERLPNGTVLLQDDRFLKLGTDAILLAAACPPAAKVCDLGCGVGGVLLSVADRQPDCELVGLEINNDAAELCRLSVERNGFQRRARVLTGDLRSLPESLAPGSFDAVVCNPPYLREGSGKEPSDPNRRLERVDATAKPWDVAQAASTLLKPEGVLLLVLRPDRLDDYAAACEDARLPVREVKLVAHHQGAQPSLALLAAGRGEGEVARSTMYLSEEYQAILEGGPLCLRSIWSQRP